MSSLRLAMKQSLEVASAESVVAPKKANKEKQGTVKPKRTKSADDGHNSDSSEENEASLQDLDESLDSSDEDGEVVNETPDQFSGNSKNRQLNKNTAAHKIQSQFRKKKDKKSDGAASGKLRTRKKKFKRRADDNIRDFNLGKEVNTSFENNGGSYSADDDNGNNSEESEVWTVTPPSESVINHMAGLSIETCRSMVTIGLRVKVHFDGSAWYGGRVSDVNKDGSEIRIRYDDDTREDATFPDTSKKGSVDIVVDAVQNGHHSTAATEASLVFLPVAAVAPALAFPSDILHTPSSLSFEIDPSLNVASIRRDPQLEQESTVNEAETMTIRRTDSKEDGEVIEPFVAPILQPTIQPYGSKEGNIPEASSTRQSIEKHSAKEPEQDAVLMLTAMPHNVNEALAGDGTDAALSIQRNDDAIQRADDTHLDESNAADDGLHKAKRKRGRPPKHRPSDATDIVDGEENVRIKATSIEQPSTSSDNNGNLDDASRNQSNAVPDRDSVEVHRVVPSLKIRMPKTSSDMELKNAKSPRTPRSPVGQEIEPSTLSFNAASISSQKKRPFDISTTPKEQPPTKKLSIRIPIHKVKPALQTTGTGSPGAEKSGILSEIVKRDGGSTPLSDVGFLRGEQNGSKTEADDNGEKHCAVQLPQSSVTSSTVSESTDPSPISPKQTKKLKKKRLLLAAAAYKLAQGQQEIATAESSAISSGPVDNVCDPSDVANESGKAFESKGVEASEVNNSEFLIDELGDFALEGPMRSERRAAQQANERIVAKQDTALPTQLTGKKKKKRDRHKDTEGVSHPGIEEVEDENQWAQCDKCGKWRVIPSNVVQHLPKQWYCTDNKYDPSRASCDAPEQTAKELAKEKKKRLKKRQRMMKAAEAEVKTAAEISVTLKVESKLVEPQVRKEKSIEVVKSPRPARDVPEESEKPFKPPKRTVPDDDQVRGGDTADVRSKKDKKTLGKKGRFVAESVEKATAEEVVTPAEVAKPRGRGRPRRSQGKESTTEPGQPIVEDPDNLEWVQCEKCNKWRKLPPHVSADDLPDIWTCNLNDWNPMSASCDAPEDQAEGLQDIGVFGSSGATAGKLTYRHLIFGSTGRKANRPITERTRAAESIFAAQFDEEDAPSKVLYADSSCYVYRGRSNTTTGDGVGMSMLELMSHSQLWQELRGENQPIGNNLLNSQLNLNSYTFDTLPLDIQRSIKDYVLLVMDVGTFSGGEILNMTKRTNVDALPEGLRKAYVYCTKNVVTTTLCQLVKEGKVDCIQKIRSSWPIREWNPLYRRVTKRILQPEVQPVPNHQPRKTTPKVSRFMKISKPWKYANVEAKSV